MHISLNKISSACNRNFKGYPCRLEEFDFDNKKEALLPTNSSKPARYYDTYVLYPQDKITDELKKNYQYLILPKTDKHDVAIIDHGLHAKLVSGLLKALSDKAQVKNIDYLSDPKDILKIDLGANQDVFGLYREVSFLNNSARKPEYVIIPALCNAHILNLKDRLQVLNGTNARDLSPKNLDKYKPEILKMLKKMHKDSSPSIKEETLYLDENNQGYKWLYPLIGQINKLVASGVKVYIPAGHGTHNHVEWASKKYNYIPLYHNYLKDGYDFDGRVKNLHNEANEKLWYHFNLLALSNATSIGITKANGSDFVFNAYDSFVKDKARGVYNLCPIRENNEIKGYSFTDEKTVQLPKDAVKVSRSADRFVGKGKEIIETDPKECLEVREYLARGKEQKAQSNQTNRDYINSKKNKLFPTEAVYDENFIRDKKLSLLGEFTDFEGKHFYSLNNNGQIYSKQYDIENSKRPSSMAVWGTCFAAAAKAAEQINETKEDPEHSKIIKEIEEDRI